MEALQSRSESQAKILRLWIRSMAFHEFVRAIKSKQPPDETKRGGGQGEEVEERRGEERRGEERRGGSEEEAGPPRRLGTLTLCLQHDRRPVLSDTCNSLVSLACFNTFRKEGRHRPRTAGIVHFIDRIHGQVWVKRNGNCKVGRTASSRNIISISFLGFLDDQRSW